MFIKYFTKSFKTSFEILQPQFFYNLLSDWNIGISFQNYICILLRFTRLLQNTKNAIVENIFCCSTCFLKSWRQGCKTKKKTTSHKLATYHEHRKFPKNNKKRNSAFIRTDLGYHHSHLLVRHTSAGSEILRPYAWNRKPNGSCRQLRGYGVQTGHDRAQTVPTDRTAPHCRRQPTPTCLEPTPRKRCQKNEPATDACATNIRIIHYDFIVTDLTLCKAKVLWYYPHQWFTTVFPRNIMVP